MKSWKLGKIAGIPIFIHWSFWILIGWILFANVAGGETIFQAIKGSVFIFAIFGCVLLHELGHALMAKRFGIGTSDITLLPIGGVAKLERMPEKPREEFLVAIAGPLVNVVIAGAIFVGLLLTSQITPPAMIHLPGAQFMAHLMYVNLALVIFNMLPAFPMDGGRIFRSLLATRMNYVRATDIAAKTGQFMAILFGVLGIFANPMLLFIAVFVYFGAKAEANYVRARYAYGTPPQDMGGHRQNCTVVDSDQTNQPNAQDQGRQNHERMANMINQLNETFRRSRSDFRGRSRY